MDPHTIAAIISIFWLGMVFAISFIEAPLKFRAPGVTIKLGLGIGKIIFRALNTAEMVLAGLVLISLIIGGWQTGAIWLVIAISVLTIQLAVVRPTLSRRSARVLAGETSKQRSHWHWAYVGFEVIKLVSLLMGGVLLLSLR